MRIVILGAAGFIGTNLALEISKNKENEVTLVDTCKSYFADAVKQRFSEQQLIETSFDQKMNYSVLNNQDVVYHLFSSNVPTTSNQHISQDMEINVLFSARLFDECVKRNVKKVVFISSGGTVYGKNCDCPLSEDTPTDPITSYGVQKLAIEKLLYLYHYMYGLDYRIIRLSNPYGPYQRPNGIQGAVTTFTYRALKNEEITVFGDGSVIRDYIYIDDAVRGIINIVNGTFKEKLYNLGSGSGKSICEVLDSVKRALGVELKLEFKEKRAVDVPINYLDIHRYEHNYGKLNPISLEDGIRRTADFMKRELL